MSDDGMYDPNKGRVDIEGAEATLGIDDDAREYLRMVALLQIVKVRLEITDAEVDQQYEQTLKQQLKAAKTSLDALVRGGLDE